MNDTERESLVTIFEPKIPDTIYQDLQQDDQDRESPEITCVEEVNVGQDTDGGEELEIRCQKCPQLFLTEADLILHNDFKHGEIDETLNNLKDFNVLLDEEEEIEGRKEKQKTEKGKVLKPKKSIEEICHDLKNPQQPVIKFKWPKLKPKTKPPSDDNEKDIVLEESMQKSKLKPDIVSETKGKESAQVASGKEKVYATTSQEEPNKLERRKQTKKMAQKDQAKASHPKTSRKSAPSLTKKDAPKCFKRKDWNEEGKWRSGFLHLCQATFFKSWSEAKVWLEQNLDHLVLGEDDNGGSTPKTPIKGSPKIKSRSKTPIKKEPKTPRKTPTKLKTSNETGALTPNKLVSKTPAKCVVKTPQKIETKTPKKIETKTPKKIQTKTPKKIETKTPRKLQSKTPIKTELKTPTKSKHKTPVKSESKRSAKSDLKPALKTPAKSKALERDTLKNVKPSNQKKTAKTPSKCEKPKISIKCKKPKYVIKNFNISPSVSNLDETNETDESVVEKRKAEVDSESPAKRRKTSYVEGDAQNLVEGGLHVKWDCNQCGATFPVKRNLAIHMQKKHGIYDHFDQPNESKVLKTPSKKKSWDCDACDFQFELKRDLATHKESQHKPKRVRGPRP